MRVIERFRRICGAQWNSNGLITSDLKIYVINFGHVLVLWYIPSPYPKYYTSPFAGKCVPGIDVGDPDGSPAEACITFKLGTKPGADQAFHIFTSQKLQ